MHNSVNVGEWIPNASRNWNEPSQGPSRIVQLWMQNQFYLQNIIVTGMFMAGLLWINLFVAWELFIVYCTI